MFARQELHTTGTAARGYATEYRAYDGVPRTRLTVSEQVFGASDLRELAEWCYKLAHQLDNETKKFERKIPASAVVGGAVLYNIDDIPFSVESAKRLVVQHGSEVLFINQLGSVCNQFKLPLTEPALDEINQIYQRNLP